MRILVVDDEPDIRFIVSANLVRWGHEPVEAENARRAYEACAGAHPPEIMLLDVSMPGESGIDLLERLRTDDLVPMAVAMLSAAFPGNLDAVAGQQGVRHLPKPFGLDDLEELITALVRQVEGDPRG